MSNIYNRNHPQVVSTQVPHLMPERHQQKQHMKDKLGYLQSLTFVNGNVFKKRHPNENLDLQ